MLPPLCLNLCRKRQQSVTGADPKYLEDRVLFAHLAPVTCAEAALGTQALLPATGQCGGGSVATTVLGAEIDQN